MNLSTQTSGTSRSASKPLELQVHIQVDPVWHKSFYFRTRRIATVSQQAQGRSCPSFTDDLSLKEKKRDIRSHGEHIWGHSTVTRHFPRIFLRKFLSQYLRRWHSTAGRHVLQTVNGRRQCGHIAQQVRAIDYATLSYTQTEKPVSIQNRNEEKKHIFLNKTLLF